MLGRWTQIGCDKSCKENSSRFRVVERNLGRQGGSQRFYLQRDWNGMRQQVRQSPAKGIARPGV